MEVGYINYDNRPNNNGGGSKFYIIFACVFMVIMGIQFYMGPPPQAPQPLDVTSVQEAEAVQYKITYPVETRALESQEYAITMTNLGGGRILDVTIKDPERYSEHGDFIRSQKPDKENVAGILPLQLTLKSFDIEPETQFKTVSPADAHDTVAFTYTDPKGFFQVDKTFTTTETPYVVHASVALTNRSPVRITDTMGVSLFIRQIEGEEPGLFTPGSFVAAKCYADGAMEMIDATDKNDSETFGKNLKWFGIDESYFTIAMTADYATACEIKNEMPEKVPGQDAAPQPLLTSSVSIPVSLEAGTTARYEFDIYVGPKESRYLDAFGEDRNLQSVIDYGWMEFLAKPMAWILDFFHKWTGNWGLAIILLTCIVRLLLWPIAQKSQLSMMRMSKLAPLMQEIQEKYKDDPVTMQQKQLELYQQHKASPFGCLPLLLQMPVFFALYRCIFVTGGLYKAPFFGWITDLSARDPYFILPLISVGLMVGQQLLTPTATNQNKQQKIMMYSMPVIFGAMLLFLPAGLCLYMVVSSIFSMVQSFHVRHIIAQENAQDATPKGVTIDADGTIDVESTK